jgi:hypothetical protein
MSLRLAASLGRYVLQPRTAPLLLYRAQQQQQQNMSHSCSPLHHHHHRYAECSRGKSDFLLLTASAFSTSGQLLRGRQAGGTVDGEQQQDEEEERENGDNEDEEEVESEGDFLRRCAID